MRPHVLVVLAAATAACATPRPPRTPSTPWLTVEVASSERGEGSFAQTFLAHANERYDAGFADLESADWRGNDDRPPGADSAHVLVVEAQGYPGGTQFSVRHDSYVSVNQLEKLGRPEQGVGGLLRYLWLVTCHVLAHGPVCRRACPLPGQDDWGPRNCDGRGAPECFGLRRDDANAIERWQRVLDSHVRTVCGGSTTVLGSSSEADAVWWYLNQGMPPADAFILGLLVRTGTADVPVCLARGLQDPALSPLYDPAFTGAPNDTSAQWYHAQYPIVLDPGDPLPDATTLPGVVNNLAPDPACYAAPGAGCQRAQSCDAGGPGTRRTGSPAAVSRQREQFEANALDVVHRIEDSSASRLTRQPRLFEMRVDTYAPPRGDAPLRADWTRRTQVKAVYAVFRRVVPVDIEQTEVTIPELGAGGLVVVAMDPRGRVTHVWQHLRPVTGPRPPAADESVLGVSDARERAREVLRARLGRGESVSTGPAQGLEPRGAKTYAPAKPQPRLETWGFKDVGGELRAFYVFEYGVRSKSGGERIERIEVPGVLRTASAGRDVPSRSHPH